MPRVVRQRTPTVALPEVQPATRDRGYAVDVRNLETILQELGEHICRVFHVRAGRVEIFVDGQAEPAFRLPVPEPPPERKLPFVPTPLQEGILEALKGKALRTDALANKVGCHRNQLFQRPGGLHELREHGMVDNHHRIGYYRPDAPPPELALDQALTRDPTTASPVQ
jgi:hypothetical protein